MKRIAAGTLVCLMAVATAGAQQKEYTRVGISYAHTGYGLNNDAKALAILEAEDASSSVNPSGVGTNGFSFDYTHGWRITKKWPMYVEAGVRLTYTGGGHTWAERSFSVADLVSDGRYSGMYVDVEQKVKLQNFSLVIPVSWGWRFENVYKGVSVMPYTGLNLKFNLMTRGRLENRFSGTLPAELSDWSLKEFDGATAWANLHSKGSIADALSGGYGEGIDFDELSHGEAEEYAEQLTFKRFQMGWQIGVGLQYERYYVGLEYALDFLPALSHTSTDNQTVNVPGVGSIKVPVELKPRVNTGTFRLSVAYCF